MSERAQTVILALLKRKKKRNRIMKNGNERASGKFLLFALIGSWVFFFAMWWLKIGQK
ncbi:hypothetical protein ACS0TY_023181 [Phlomoides rotata]